MPKLNKANNRKIDMFNYSNFFKGPYSRFLSPNLRLQNQGNYTPQGTSPLAPVEVETPMPGPRLPADYVTPLPNKPEYPTGVGYPMEPRIPDESMFKPPVYESGVGYPIKPERPIFDDNVSALDSLRAEPLDQGTNNQPFDYGLLVGNSGSPSQTTSNQPFDYGLLRGNTPLPTQTNEPMGNSNIFGQDRFINGTFLPANFLQGNPSGGSNSNYSFPTPPEMTRDPIPEPDTGMFGGVEPFPSMEIPEMTDPINSNFSDEDELNQKKQANSDEYSYQRPIIDPDRRNRPPPPMGNDFTEQRRSDGPGYGRPDPMPFDFPRQEPIIEPDRFVLPPPPMADGGKVPSGPSPEMLAKLMQLRDQLRPLAEANERRQQGIANMEKANGPLRLPTDQKAQGGNVNAFDYENPEHVQAIVGNLAQHGTLNKIPNVAKHLGEILSSGDYRHMEDPRVQGSLRKAGHTGYYALEKTGKKLHPLPPAYVARKAMG